MMDRIDVFLSTCDTVLFRFVCETERVEVEWPSRRLLFRADVSADSESAVCWYLPRFACPNPNFVL